MPGAISRITEDESETKMALLKPKFENPDEDTVAVAENPAAPVAEKSAATAPVEAKVDAATAVAVRPEINLPTPLVSTGDMHVLKKLKDNLFVDYNTLAQVKAEQGAFSDRETEENLGSQLVVEVLSWQDSFVCSPNDDDAEKELVKYSDDGVTAKDGTDMKAHLEHLRSQGYDKARTTHRLVVVGALLESEKPSALTGNLVQIDLPPTGKTQWDRYNANCAWNIRTGKLTEEGAKRVLVKAVVAKGQGSVKYTLVTFSTAPK